MDATRGWPLVMDATRSWPLLMDATRGCEQLPLR
jgi:hypothetical protein